MLCCLTAIVKSLISIACNGRGSRPRHKLCLCVCIRKLQVSVSVQIKNTSHMVRVFLFWCGLAALRPHRLSQSLQASCLFLVVTETCLTAIVKSLISIACNGRGSRPRHKLCLCVCIRKLQVSVSVQIKNTSRLVRVFFVLVRSPRLELGRVHHTPLKRTRLPIPP